MDMLLSCYLVFFGKDLHSILSKKRQKVVYIGNNPYLCNRYITYNK